MRSFRVFFLVTGILSLALGGCGGQTSQPPQLPAGIAAVGTVTSTASPAPGQTGWPCTVQLYTATSGTAPASAPGTCGTGQGNAPSGSLICQITLPTGGAAVGWCLPAATTSPSASPGTTATATGTVGPLLISLPSLSITLSLAQVPSQQFTVSEATGYPTTFTAVSSNPAVATVSPGSSSGTFSVTEISTGMTNVTITDSLGNTLNIPVTAQ